MATQGARAKLTPLGVFHHFGFGGFGCDHEERPEILRIGAKRAAAARAIGAEAVGIGSARFSPGELLASGAAHAFGDLAAAGVLPALLGGAV
ncbi:MAG TPA: hypothetical protein VEM57_09995 [Candidatus Binatus sp.]|nr:hypothetical protein [Candidatus Binatus sp.]